MATKQPASALQIGSKLAAQYAQLVKQFSKLLVAELQLAKRSVFPLFFSFLFYSLLIASGWFCVLATFIIACWHLSHSLLLSFIIAALINITIAYMVYFFGISSYKRNLTLPVTRQLLNPKNSNGKHHEQQHDKERH